jgi:hypothetical protein
MKSNIQYLATITGYIPSYHFHLAFPFRQEKRRFDPVASTAQHSAYSRAGDRIIFEVVVPPNYLVLFVDDMS